MQSGKHGETWRQGWWSAARPSPSPNFGPRPAGAVVSLIVLHNISLPPDIFGGPQVEQFFANRLNPAEHPYFATLAEVRVSAHFFLRRNGEVVQCVSANDRAWHAGKSVWQGRENCNDYSIGIELEGSDASAYPPAQYVALWPLLHAIQSAYPVTAIAGHEHIASHRKTDPGPHFDWQTLAARFPGMALPAAVRYRHSRK
jgi:AmpD protein